jgi:hypothetical protein
MSGIILRQEEAGQCNAYKLVVALENHSRVRIGCGGPVQCYYGLWVVIVWMEQSLHHGRVIVTIKIIN